MKRYCPSGWEKKKGKEKKKLTQVANEKNQKKITWFARKPEKNTINEPSTSAATKEKQCVLQPSVALPDAEEQSESEFNSEVVEEVSALVTPATNTIPALPEKGVEDPPSSVTLDSDCEERSTKTTHAHSSEGCFWYHGNKLKLNWLLRTHDFLNKSIEKAGARTRPYVTCKICKDYEDVAAKFSRNGTVHFARGVMAENKQKLERIVDHIKSTAHIAAATAKLHDEAWNAQSDKHPWSIVMLMFREEKSPDDEIKAWQFWHGRQHSVKQRILDADTKNSVGLVGCIEEVAHNAIAVYWNPLDSPAKINVAVQCLSTDFSSQKGVKGLPLHLQIDTYEDHREPTVNHRAYCQIKVFCDKGAERKTRDEERRAAKRKMTATGRKKLDELYHPVCDRSEFYSMSDLTKPPVLFTPAEDIDKLTSMELQGFYPHDTDSSLSGPADHVKSSSPFLLHTAGKQPTTPTLKFHNHFPPDADKKDNLLDNSLTTDGALFSPPLKRAKVIGSVSGSAGPPPLNERVMLYVRQESEDVYTPLHVVPPTTVGLLNAIENKYKISASSINNLYRKNKKGITAKIDDDMVAYYCNEDLFLLELKAVDEELYDITFIELMDH